VEEWKSSNHLAE